MKKLTISILILLGTFSMASAEVGVKVGVSGELGLMEAHATEISSDGAVADVKSSKREALFGKASYFIEKDLKFISLPIINRISLGYDNITHDLSLGTTTNHMVNRLSDKASPESVDSTNTAKASITGFETVYATLNVFDWLYVKAGEVSVDVKTSETMATGGIYPNASLDGTVFGVGIHTQTDNGWFSRLEMNDYSIDGTTLVNTGTDSKRSVKLSDVEGVTYSLKFGKSF